MKGRKLILVACLLLALTMSLTGTIAYLTDTDSDVNVMVLGNVDIEQTEWDDIDAKVPYTQDKPLYPAYYGDDKDETKPDTITGEVNKYVKVTNKGNSDAFVRTVFAFEGTEVEKKIHVVGNETDWTWEWLSTPVEIKGVKYTIAVATYPKVLAGKAETPFSLNYIYMDKTANNADVAVYGGTYEVLVQTQAVQTTNLEKLGSAKALDEAFGTAAEKAADWFGGVTPVQGVSTAEELTAALAEGGTVRLAADIKLADAPVVIKDSDVTIDLAGHKLSGVSTSSTTSYMFKVNSGKTLTLKNGTVSFGATTPDTNWGGDGQPAFPGYANNTISCSGNLIIDGATVENTTKAGGASYAIDCYPGANVTIESGRVDGYDKTAIRMFANSATVPTSVTINGGTVTGSRAIWIHLPGSNNTHIPPVNLTVNGGTLSSNSSTKYRAIYSYSYGNNFDNTKIALNGGTYFGDVILNEGQGNYEGVEKLTINKNNCTFYGKVYSNNASFGNVAEANGNFVATQDAMNAAVAAGATDIVVGPGEYTFPASGFKAGQTVTCAPGTVFEGTSNLNINGATVVGATFSDDNKAVSGTINGTFKDCTFNGSEALRWCYTTEGQSVVFENCVINTDFRGFHFDNMSGDVTFKNCTIAGFNACGGSGTLTLEGCTLVDDESQYNGLNLYCDTVLTDCTFVYKSGDTNFIDMEGTGKTLTITNCTATLDGAAAKITDYVGGSMLAQNTVTVDGVAFTK